MPGSMERKSSSNGGVWSGCGDAGPDAAVVGLNPCASASCCSSVAGRPLAGSRLVPSSHLDITYLALQLLEVAFFGSTVDLSCSRLAVYI